MIIFLTTYLLIGIAHTVYSFIKADRLYQCNENITEMLSYHDWIGVLGVVLLMLSWMLIGILGITMWPILMIGDIVTKSVSKIYKH